MPNLNLRVTTDSDTSARLLNAMQAIDGVVHAEEVADLMQQSADDDSSSAGLPDDTGPGSHTLMIEADTERAATLARRVAEELATGEGFALEFTQPR
jgi:hypothetical protein